MLKKRIVSFFILALSLLLPKIQTRDESMRNLIIISDVISQDDDPDPDAINKFFNNSVFMPGPTGEILRDMMRERCAPIFVSKDLFQRCYNFCTFAHHIVEQDTKFIEKTYGKQVIPTNFPKDNFIESLQALVRFLLHQHATAQSSITQLLNQKVEPHAIQQATMQYLKDRRLSSQDFTKLINQLGLENYPLMPFLARNVIMYYKAFIPTHWTVYATRNGNYFMLPLGYPDKDFGMRYLYKTELTTTELPLEAEFTALEKNFAGKFFVEDLERLINGVHTIHKKPLTVFMTGHGSLPKDKFSSGIGLTDFHNLITTLGRGNTYAFFYLTCHAGGTTTQNVWFHDQTKISDNGTIIPVADSMYRAPFITIVTPATEIAFSRKSPFWLEGFETNTNDYFAPWFLTKKIPPCITLPRIHDFFSLVTLSLPKALENSLYAPLYTIYDKERSIIIPQAALIKLPGTQWFYPQFFNETVFEITKTKSAQALFEKKALIQPLISNVITIATPTMYAPLVIHQTDLLRIVPLLPFDPSYATTKNHITYIKKLVIKSSTYRTNQDILWNLSYNNIGPCMIIPTNTDDPHKNDMQKICVIDEIINPAGQTIARNFVLTAQGSFYITDEKLLRFTQETRAPKATNKAMSGLFNRVQHAIENLLKNDQEAKNSTQTVLHKFKTMKVLDAMLKNRIHKQ